MPVSSVHKDPETKTMIITADLDAPVDRAWELVADPRQLERWWGPPGYPATVDEHDLSAGGNVGYFMTGPEGDTHRGYWKIEEVEPPRTVRFQDGFADDTGVPNPQMPVMTMTISFDHRDGGSRMTVETVFASTEAMEQVLQMGMEEGMTAALGQIDGILAGSAA